MKNFKELADEICKELSLVDNEYCLKNGDLSDIGNHIGMVVGKYIKKGEPGFELSDLKAGLEHGISIADGTHPQ